MEAAEVFLVTSVSCFAAALVFSFAMSFIAPEPLPPSVSVESVSMTVVNVTSDSQVKANSEVVFYPIQNPNLNNTIIIYNHVKASAFHGRKLDMPAYPSETPILDKVAVAPFEQRGGDQRRVAVQTKGVIVDIDEYEQHIHGRYGVLYLTLELKAVVETQEGKRKKTHNMRAECLGGTLKIVFPVELPWNQTKRFDFQPPNACHVHGWPLTT